MPVDRFAAATDARGYAPDSMRGAKHKEKLCPISIVDEQGIVVYPDVELFIDKGSMK